MRTLPFVAAGQEWAMPANFATLQSVAERVGDPFDLLMRWGTLQAGEAALTAMQTVDTLCIGLQAAGCKATRAELANELLERGLLSLSDTAAGFITLLATAATGEPAPEAGAKKKTK